MQGTPSNLHRLHVEANSRKIEQSLAQVNFPTVSFHVEIAVDCSTFKSQNKHGKSQQHHATMTSMKTVGR
jgi:hypothetical protein